MLIIIEKHTVRTIVMEILIIACILLELKSGYVTASRSMHMLICQLSAIAGTG